MKNYKRGNSALIIFLVVLVLAAGATWYLSQNSQNPSRSVLDVKPVPTPAPVDNSFTTAPAPTPTDPMAGWKTYTNDEYGFEFKYPADLSPVQTSEGSESLMSFASSLRRADNNKGYSFEVFKISDSADAYQQKLIANTYYDGSGLNPKSFAEFKQERLGANDFYSIQTGSGFEAVFATNYFLVSPKSIYSFNLVSRGGDMGKMVLNQILSTFRFTNSKATDETAGRKTYTNDKYGFSFKYPANWKVEDKSSTGQELSKGVSICPPTGKCLELSNGLDSSNLSYRLGSPDTLSPQEKNILLSIKNF